MTDTAAHGAHPPGFAHQFEDMEQQLDTDTLGMWVFLVTEIMFFGGLFAAYIVYRVLHFDAFETGSRLLNYRFGALNTVVLICSSLTMALAIHAAQVGKRRMVQIGYLIITMLFGLTFLLVKFIGEWHHDWVEGLVPGLHWTYSGAHNAGVQLFFCFYFFMTGLHALHMIVGLGILTVLVIMAWRGRFTPEYHAPLEISGLYWHFVDIVWIFLFPLLYLIGGVYTMGGGPH